MALYRHNATGFLGEFAANPGAGYTAVSTMPTDTVVNRVAWWRALDTYGQTSSWHPSLYRSPEDPREARLSLEFSQEFALISADGDGVVTNPRDPANAYYLGAATEVRVFRGVSNVTVSEGWNFEIIGDGCTAILAEVEGLHTVAISSIPDAETQVGFVRVRAFRTEDGLPPADGLGVLIKDFRFIKVLQGNDGSYVSYVFKASATTPPTPTDTTPTPAGWLDSPPVSNDPVWMSKATVTAGLAGAWSTPVKVTAIDGSDGSFTTYQYAKNTSFTTAPTTGWADTPYALSAGEYQWMRTKTTDPNTGAVSYGAAYRVTGEKGADGAAGSSGTVIDLSNEAHTIPTDADGNNGLYTGATTTASLFIGGTDDSANWTWTATASAGITGTATNSNRTYTVTAMSVDVGTVTFTATKAGQAQRTAVFTISKAKGGVAYSLDVSAGSISKSKTGVYNPTSLTLTASKITTSGVTTYAGRIRIQTQATLDGVWTTVYSSASDETTISYSVPANIVAIKAMLYLAGGFTTVLDQESVPVVFDGQDGSSGERGSRQIVITGTANWSDQTAWQGILTRFGGTAPVLSDLVTIVNTSNNTSTSKFYGGGGNGTTTWGTWNVVTEYINGNLLVTGTVGANAIAANAITAGKIASGTITTTQLSFTPVQSTNVVASINASAEGIQISGSRIKIDGTVTFGATYDPSGKIASGGAAADINANTTTISGGKITSNSITANQIQAGTITTSLLNFTPITGTNVVAAINASAEGLRILSTKIYIDGGVSFSSGYNPAEKIASGGAAADINANTTTINGGKITTNSITANQIQAGTITTSLLNFTPVTGTNVVASINASAEALRIASTKIYIDGGVSFSSGYNPAEKIASGGAATDINSNTTEINGGKIQTGTLTADKITTGTISAATINLNTASSVIKTSNFALGTGFRISGDGTAFFYGASVSGSARSTNWNGTINPGTGQPSAGTGSAGWCIDNAGNAEFNTVIVRRPSNIGYSAYGASAKFESSMYTTGTTDNQTVGTYYYKANVGQTTNILLTLDCQTSLSTSLIQVTDGAGNVLWTAYDKNGTAIDSRFFSGSTSFYTAVTQSYVTLKVYMVSGGGTMGMPRINIFEIVS